MDSETRTFSGGRLPPKRTYGSKKGSRRPQNNQEQQEQTQHSASSKQEGDLPVGSNTSTLPSVAPFTQLAVRSGQANVPLAYVNSDSRKSPSNERFGSGRRISTTSIDDISLLLRSAAAGGDEGRASAITLALACKSYETRRSMRGKGESIMDDLKSAMLAALRGGDGQERDEAIVHCLSVALFILSKDRAMAKVFSSSIVSTLAALIDTHQQGLTEEESRSNPCTALNVASFPGRALLVKGRRKKSAPSGVTRAFKGVSSPPTGGRRWRGAASPLPAQGLRDSVFEMGDDDDDDHPLGAAGVSRLADAVKDRSDESPGIIYKLSPGSSIDNNTCCSSSSAKSALPLPRSREHEHGSADVMVRARMLLDITDVLPWGMTNRHLVSAVDLGLATLLNVAVQACPESGETGGVGEGGIGGESTEEEISTQGSAADQSDPSSVEALTGRVKDNEVTARNTGVIAELSRLGPSGFLLPFVIGGAAFLEDLSASRKVDKAGRGATADPSSLRMLQRLLLALRLLDLATLEKYDEGNKAKASGTKPIQPTQISDLTGVLLLVVSRSYSYYDNNGGVGEKSDRASDACGRLGKDRKQPGRQQPFVDEVSARVHECLLAALRVLINVTHNDARICAEVAARGGLDALMACLVLYSECRSRDRDGKSPLTRHRRMSSEIFSGNAADGGTEFLPGPDLDDANGDASGERAEGRAGSGAGAFDAQILAMGALINCVELKESADNCFAIASIVVRSYAYADERVGDKRHLLDMGVSSKCSAPEYLARLLIHCTKDFTHQLEVDRPYQEEGESISLTPKAQPDFTRNGQRDADSTVLTGTPAAQTPQTPQDFDGEELMSHAEGADLVLGGHCALLLGLLVREEKSNRRLVLSVLPGGTTTLIVRVLEAFMALQFQAGVLTEEVVLAVRGLVEELEGMEGLPEEEWNPFEIGSEDDASSPRFSSIYASPRKDKKRSRVPSDMLQARIFSTPPSEQRGVGAAEEGGEDDFSLSAARARLAIQGKPTSTSWLPQAGIKETLRPSDDRPDRAKQFGPWSTPTLTLDSEKKPTTPGVRAPSNSDGVMPLSQNQASGPPRMMWRVGSAVGGGFGRALGGGSAAGTRTWLGSPQTRTYGRKSTYVSRIWKKAPQTPSRFRPSTYGNSGAMVERGDKTRNAGSDDVLGVLSDAPEDVLQQTEFGSTGGGGKGRLAHKSKDRSRGAASVSVYDLECWSDSSNESPVKLTSRRLENKAMTVEMAISRVKSSCPTQSKNITASGFERRGANGLRNCCETELTGQIRSDGRQKRVPNLPPTQPEEIASPPQGAEQPSSDMDSKGQTVKSASTVSCAKTGQRLGKGKTGMGFQLRTRTIEEDSCNWRVGRRSPRPTLLETLGRQDERGPKPPPPIDGRGSSGKAAAGSKPATTVRSVFDIGSADIQGAGTSKQDGDRDVFEMGDESD